MTQNDPQSRLDALLETNLPELVRSEAARLWTQQWMGKQIESYRVESLLGTGAHGVVFRAQRSTPFERTVAIKLLPSLKGHSNLRRFQNECQALADLTHSNIAEILTAGVTADGTPYLIMPYLLAQPIDAYTDAYAADWQRIAELIRQLAAAVGFAHHHGLMHCDLKPDNILVDDKGHVTVTDFGLAVRMDELEDFAQRPSWAPGTLGYAAPELFTSKRDASPKVDIYSVGAVLYRLLTGVPPHEASGWLDSLRSATGEHVTPVLKRNPAVPRALAEICERCLANDPRARFDSVEAIEQQLASFLQKISSPVPIRSNMPRLTMLGLLGVTVPLCAILLSQWPFTYSNESTSVPTAPSTLVPPSDAEIDRILNDIDAQIQRPGIIDPAEPGDFEAAFRTLQQVSKELEFLLARAPQNKRVRKAAASGYFLLGRAALWNHEREYADECVARSERIYRDLHRDYPEDGFMFDFFHTLIVQGTLAPPRQERDIHLHALGVITALRASDDENLDYSDAHACTLQLLAADYSKTNIPELYDIAEVESYATQALEVAQWTCRQPDTRPMHRKHIMSSQSLLSEVARSQGDLKKALRLAELAMIEAQRLFEAVPLTDLKNEWFDKTIKYAIALRDVSRLEEAEVYLDKADQMAQELRHLDWPRADFCDSRVANLRDSLSDPTTANP